ncbi:hypothetical protein C0995_001831 [Termitomyces sp. Mi166|nr:hypothetical protein C0995_001831 [Termitomyces sp. Mi166\
MRECSSASITSPSSQLSEWTVERVKLEISRGSVIDYGKVVDIGNGLLVKYGTRINSREAEATKLVATHTLVPVPKIIATLYDETESVTYIVQTKLPGRSPALLLPTLNPDQQAIIEQELKEIFCQFSTLDTLGPMGRKAFSVPPVPSLRRSWRMGGGDVDGIPPLAHQDSQCRPQF